MNSERNECRGMEVSDSQTGWRRGRGQIHFEQDNETGRRRYGNSEHAVERQGQRRR
jgi:hypothetical protein